MLCSMPRITDTLLCAYDAHVGWRIHYSLRWLANRWDDLVAGAEGLPLLHAWLRQVDTLIFIPLCYWLTDRGFDMWD